MDTSGTPVHLTYRAIADNDTDLKQGDIIEPAEGLRNLMREVHPHFNDDKYVAFLVLTQTCDLVRRDGKLCKSRYINLAVVRPLRDVLIPFLDRACGTITIGGITAEGIYVDNVKFKAEQLLHHIFNQNAQAEGLFYLHPDAAVRIAEPSVALLQVSVAVRSQEHYQTLLAARMGGLQEQFQSKLGWLIGNLFARVATQDLAPTTRKRLVMDFLGRTGSFGENSPRWVSKEQVRLADKANVDISDMPRHEIVTVLNQHKPALPRDIALERVTLVLRESLAAVTPEQIEAVKARLAADAVFESACRPRAS